MDKKNSDGYEASEEDSPFWMRKRLDQIRVRLAFVIALGQIVGIVRDAHRILLELLAVHVRLLPLGT